MGNTACCCNMKHERVTFVMKAGDSEHAGVGSANVHTHVYIIRLVVFKGKDSKAEIARHKYTIRCYE